MDLDVSHFELTSAASGVDAENRLNASPAKEEYKRTLASKLFQDVPLHDQRILAFSGRQPQQSTEPPLRLLYNANREAAMQPRKHTRHIPQSPERILDAPICSTTTTSTCSTGRRPTFSVLPSVTRFIYGMPPMGRFSS